jgi:DNA-binding NtrC family response regulator
MARILSISYDTALLGTRHLLLERMGHTVTSVRGLRAAIALCQKRGTEFNLIVIGHSMPRAQKLQMIECARKYCRCPVLVLLRAGESPVPGATHSVDPFEPEALIEAVEKMVGRGEMPVSQPSDVPK